MNRKSVSFAPDGRTKSKAKGRNSESAIADEDDEDQRDPNTVLYETLMSDPVKRAMVLQLLENQKEAIEEYKRKEQEQLRAAARSPLNKLKRNLMLESPTALLRRRALQQRTADLKSSSSECSTPSPSPVEFEKLLEGVKVFVDVRSKNKDRSDAIKALVRSMGAQVKDEFTNSVTHVIFKDGSFQTYHKAKLLKKHLVSVLWVESVRTSHTLVPEHNYPALGTPTFEKNVSFICEKMQDDYQEVLKDEMSRSFNTTSLSQKQSRSSKPHRKTTLPSEFYFTAMSKMSKSTMSIESQPGTSEDIIPGSQDMEVALINSAGRKKTITANSSKTPDSCLLPGSDSDSNCGVIDGESFSKNKSSQSSTLLPLSPKSDGAVSETLNLSPVNCDGDNKNDGKKTVRRTLYSEVDFIKSNFPNVLNMVKGSPFVTKRRKTTAGFKERSPKKIDNKENNDVLQNISEENSSNTCNQNTKPKFNDKFITRRRRTRLNSNPNRDLDLYFEENLNLKQPDKNTVSNQQTFTNPKESLESNATSSSEDMGAAPTFVAALNSGNRFSSSQKIVPQNDVPPLKTNNPRESLESNATSNSEDMSAVVRRTRRQTVAALNSEEFKVPGNRRSSSQKIVPEKDAPPLTTTKPRESLESNATSNSEDMSAFIRRTRKSVAVLNCDEFKVPGNRRSSSQKILPPRLSDASTIVSRSEDIIGRKISTNSVDEMPALRISDSSIDLSLKVDSDIPSQSKSKASTGSFSSLSSTSGSLIKDILEDLDRDTSKKSEHLLNTSKTRKSTRGTPKISSKNLDPNAETDTSLSKKDVVKRRMSTRNSTKMNRYVDAESNESEDIHISDASSKQDSIESDESIIADTQEEAPNNAKDSKDTTNPPVLKDPVRRSTRLSVSHMKPNSKPSPTESTNSSGTDNFVEIRDKEKTLEKELNKSAAKSNSSSSKSASTSGSENRFKAPKGQARKALRKKINKSNEKKTDTLLTSDESESETVKKNTKPKAKRKSNELLTSDESESESKRKKVQSKSKTTVELSGNDKTEKQTIPETPDNNVTNSSSDSSGQKRRRKLYDPNASMESVVKTQILKDVNTEPEKKEKPAPAKPGIIFTESALKYHNRLMDQEKQAETILNLIAESSELSAEPDLNIPTKKPKKTVTQKKVVVNPDLDEQTNLLNELLDKRKTPRRQQKNQETNTLPIKPFLNRRSTMDFVPKQTPTPKKTPSKRAGVRKPSIVCTRFHRNEVVVFQQIVKKLGGFNVENNVVESTTHLVCGESSRTINILRAMAKGIWILRAEWLYRSLENGKWLPEEEYELTEFNPAVKQCRIQQQTFGSKYAMDIFQKCGAIYVTKNTSPKCSDLEELIRMCKGTVARNARVADIVVGEFLRFDNVTCVKELWVLDSITFNRCKNVRSYKIEPPKPRTSDHF